jgi:hypothetical protein
MKTSHTFHRLTSFIFASAIVTSCVTTHYGDPTSTKDGNLLVSCGKDDRLSTASYQTISCSLENKGKGWETVRVYEAKANQGAKALTPTEVDNYFASLKLKLEQDNYNTNLALTAITIGGLGAALAGSGSGNSGVATAGVAAIAGAGAVGAGRDITAAHDKAQYQQQLEYGPDHLLDKEIKIPAGLYVRKKIIYELGSSTEAIKSLSLCFDEKKQDCRDIPVRI